MTGLADLLVRLAEKAPSRLFLTGETPLTYAEAAAEMRRRARTMDRETPLLLSTESAADWIIDVLAALAATKLVVLVPPSWTFAERAPVEEWMGRACEDRAFRERGAALAFATSGTTGRPRLVVRSAASLEDEGQRYVRLFEVTPTDVIAAALPLCHAYAFGAVLAAAIAGGASILPCDRSSPRETLRLAIEHRATVVVLVPVLARLLAALDRGRPVENSMRIAMVGAGPVTMDVARAFHGKTGVALSQNYGSSETGATLACFAPHVGESTGHPLDGVECSLGADDGDVGQLWIRTATPPLGHVDTGGFTPAELAPGGFWATGDVFRRQAPRLYAFVARLDGRIRRGGRTIDPIEVERAIAAHPSVAEAHVRPERASGRDDGIAATVALSAPSAVTVSELRRHVAERLADYKVPTTWHLANELTRTASGKVRYEDGSAVAPLSVFDALLRARLGPALLAADEVGLLEAVAERPRDVAELAHDLALDPEALALFARCLTDAGLLVTKSDALTLVAKLPPRPVLALEQRLAVGWLSRDAIVTVLRAGVRARPYDQIADPEFDAAYALALANDEVKSLASVLIAIAGGPRGLRALEIARTGSILAPVLGEAVSSVVLASPRAGIRFGDLCPEAGRYGLIAVVNAVHWLDGAMKQTAIPRLLAGLSKGGVLAFVDIFLDGDGARTSSSFLLDWLTHGGIHSLDAEDLTSSLQDAGATSIRHRHLTGTLSIVYGSSPLSAAGSR